MFAARVVALLLLAGCSAPTPEQQVEAAVAPVHAAYAKVDADLAGLPPAKDDSERLERLLLSDQAGRRAMERIDYAGLTEAQQAGVRGTAMVEISARDRANLAALKTMLPAEGWFTKDRYSKDAREAAFLIVQHASSDPAFMREALARMEPLVATGDVSGTSFAMLYDRVALHEGRLQRYGTQMACREKRWTLAPLEEKERVDQRRKQVGFTETLAEYEARFAKMPDCA